MSKADPKHGRWILPLVIAGLIGFTYLFVDALPPAAVETDDTTPAVANTGEDTGGTDTDGSNGTTVDNGQTTTTLPAEVAAFLAAVDDFETRTAALAQEAQTINDDWDSDTIGFGETRDALSNLGLETTTLTSEINDAVVPPAAQEAWNVVIASSQTLDTAAADMLDGLVNSSTADKRLAALDTYMTTTADLAVGFDLARSAIGG